MHNSLNIPLSTLIKIQILGYLDLELTRGHYQGLKYDIMIEIERNLIFSKANPELIKTFTDNNCPYDCNEHGTCVKGKN